MKELEGVKNGLNQEDNREEYFRVSQKYNDLKKHKKKMSIANNNKKYYDFSELDLQSKILKKKKQFFDNYLKNGKMYKII